MPQSNYLFPMPEIPGVGQVPTYDAIINMLKTPTATMSQFLPEMESVLSGRSQFLAPQIETFNQQLSGVLANLQGEFGKRGLTGSSIEAQGLATAQGQGLHSLSSMLADFSLEGANTFAGMLERARSGDVLASRQLIESLAQAMGEEMSRQGDMQMFERGLSAKKQSDLMSGLFGLGQAGIGALGSRASSAPAASSYLPPHLSLTGTPFATNTRRLF